MNQKGHDSRCAIEARGISKRFRDRLVLDNVSLTVTEGQIHGLIGHNGSGKSVLLRVISGLVRPSTGEVTVFGQRIGRDLEFSPETGALIDTPGFLLHNSGFSNLQLLAMIRDRITKDDIAAAMRMVGLDARDRRPVRTYSTGMRQRLGLAQALMEQPRLLLLDEPTNGLDREGTRDVHRLLKDLRASGITILLASHLGDEVQDLCDAVYLMEEGRLSSAAGSTIIDKTR